MEIIANEEISQLIGDHRQMDVHAIAEDVIETKQVVVVIIRRRVVEREVNRMPETIVDGDLVDFDEHLFVQFEIDATVGDLNDQDMLSLRVVDGHQFH